MRLWDWRLLPYLPKGQLLSQKRECDLIWKDIANGKKTNHILINYIWDYQDYETELMFYYRMLYDEFVKRGFKFNYHKNSILVGIVGGYYHKPFPIHHNNRYLLQCFMNLSEKYFRKQRDFDEQTYNKLYHFVNKELNGILDSINEKL